MKYKIKCVLFLFPRCKTATEIPMIRNIEGNRTETKTTLRSIKTDTNVKIIQIKFSKWPLVLSIDTQRHTRTCRFGLQNGPF